MRRQQATGNRQQGEEIADNIRLLAILPLLQFVNIPALIAIFIIEEYGLIFPRFCAIASMPRMTPWLKIFIYLKILSGFYKAAS
ncbi:hypothetical protein [Okeania sp. SIO2C2]|uniref:hypothetical protein n=1 Tax=Okeania sp. SIO2C2 TaxID=2607787 RepID=UPI00257F84AF|nr:hypothetical protein [Okeania sp. SIO2C2]